MTADRARRFAPGLGATLATAAVFVLLLALGGWQLQRLAWKEALIADLELRSTAEPVPLPAAITNIDAWRYRRVAAKGRFDHGREMLVPAGRGFDVVTPLIRDSAPAVLVVRGWVPEAKRDPASRREGLVAGRISITGIVRRPPGRGVFTPDNVPAESIWYWRDLAAMSRYAGLSDPLPVFIEAEGSAPGGWPKGGVTRRDLPNRHLEYALTWFALALALAGIFFIHGRRQAKSAR